MHSRLSEHKPNILVIKMAVVSNSLAYYVGHITMPLDLRCAHYMAVIAYCTESRESYHGRLASCKLDMNMVMSGECSP